VAGGVQSTFSHDRYVVVVELQLLDALQRGDEIGSQASQKVVRQVERLEFGQVGQRGAGHSYDAVVGQVQVRQRGHRPKTVVFEHVDLVVVKRQRHDPLEPGKRSAPDAGQLVVRQRYDLYVRQPGQRAGAQLTGQKVGAEVQFDQRPHALEVGSRSGRQQIVLEPQYFQERQADESVRADEVNGIIAQVQKRQIRRSL